MTAMRNEPRSAGYRRPVLALADEAHVVEMYARGWSLRDIARDFSCTTAPIVRVLKKHGVTMRETNNPGGRATVAATRARPQMGVSTDG